jgi:hypothetical protein
LATFCWHGFKGVKIGMLESETWWRRVSRSVSFSCSRSSVVVKQSRSIQSAHSIRFEFLFQCTMLACTPERWDIWNISEVLAYGTVTRILYTFIFVSSTNPQWNRFVPARHYPRPQTWTSQFSHLLSQHQGRPPGVGNARKHPLLAHHTSSAPYLAFC